MRCFISRLKIISGLILVLVCTALFAYLSACSLGKAERVPKPFTLYFTCDTNGRFEPCGCFAGQHGGLTRLRTFLNSDTGSQAILADVGDAIDGTADYQVIKYQYIQEAYATMGYAALNMGQREAQLSAVTLRKLAEHAPVPMICANLVDAKTGERILPAYRVLPFNGRKIAFVGVVEPPEERETLGDGVAVEPMNAALSKVLPELRGQADAFVLLAFASEEAMRQLAREFYEFDIILGGRVREPAQKLIQENRSVIAYTTNESKAVGVINGVIGEKPAVKAKDFTIVFLSDQIAQDPTLLARSQAYRDEVRMTKLDVDKPNGARDDTVPGVAPVSHYVGSESCQSCHASAFKKWQNSDHAHAFESLAVKRADADPSCIGCHTVGFGSPSGYRREFAGKKLAGVGCESCHGPGSEHIAQHQSGGKVLVKYRTLGAADCAGCHYGEFSRPFKWELFWPAIKHGKEQATNRGVVSNSNL